MLDLILVFPGIYIVQYPAMGVVIVCLLEVILLCIEDGLRGGRLQCLLGL